MAWFSRRLAEKMGLSPGSLVYIGDKPTTQSRLTLTQYSDADLNVDHCYTWPECQSKIKPGLFTWVQVEGLQDVKLVEAVGRHFQIHAMSLEDILNTHHRPKLNEFDHYLHIVFKIPIVDAVKLRIHYTHASLILGSNFVISFVEGRSEALRPIVERLASGGGRLRQLGPAYLTFAILDLSLDHFYLALSRLEEAVDQMETQILASPSDLLLGRLYEVKRENALMRKMSTPIRGMVKELNKMSTPLIDETYEVYYKDLEDHAVQIVDTSESIKETLGTILDVSDSYSSHNSNNLFKFFTVISAVFLPLNFLASLYGMNFLVMPGLSDPAGFYVMTGAMSAIAVSVLVYLRFNRWL